MGQFSRDLMVIAFLGGHIAFHPVQCVRPIYQSSSLSRALSDKGGCQGGVDVATRRREGERIRVCVYVWVALQRGGERERATIQRPGSDGGNRREERRRDVDRAATGNPSAAEHSSPLGGRALPDCRREVAEVWPRS